MSKLVIIFLLFVFVGSGENAVAQELPLPRFVSLKSAEANVRKGPGLNYPIKWVLVRKNMPVEVIAEFEQWRRIRDIDGEEGWVHRAMLNGSRSVTIQGNAHTLYKNPGEDSQPIALIESGVSAELIECEEEWCRVEINGYRGWVSRKSLWGIYPDEIIN